MNTLFETATLDGAMSNVSNRLRANNLFIIDNAVMKSYAAIRNVLIQTSQIYTDRVGGISRDEKELVRSLTGDVFKFVFYIESIRRYVFDPLPLLPADRFFRYGNLSNNVITLLTRLGFSGTEINNLDIGGLVDEGIVYRYKVINTDDRYDEMIRSNCYIWSSTNFWHILRDKPNQYLSEIIARITWTTYSVEVVPKPAE